MSAMNSTDPETLASRSGAGSRSDIDTPSSLELTTVELKRAEEIKQDQGLHECEVSTSTELMRAEADLHKHLSSCKKNPGHHDFIPVNTFSMAHLPVGYRDDDVLNLIKAIIDLTVCCCVTYTSFNRPKTFPNSDEPYPFYNHRGKDWARLGSGMVSGVFNHTDEDKKDGSEEKETCGCEECKTSPTPMTQWCEFQVITVGHVVFDDEEAKQTTCLLFFDSEDEKDKIQELKGGTMDLENSGKVDYDLCWMNCFTHDTELGKRLEETWMAFNNLYSKVCGKFMNSKIENPLSVIVSHPHGCSKQVTVGERTHQEAVDEDGLNTRYTYTTQTCQGSSGAPVCVVGKPGFYHFHPHSKRCEENGLNMSGVWLY